ncbi:hypothetical protein DUT91_24195 [Phyllobacterium salinisoli]|uniref:Uncharacterized protein n=1 Tax=Phyllobacterium salinisoli TaxID=1899321 RepID=A0A368JW68_9HYPH|nr:hypothetical protein [Phyllobacterium salinisoli]RCS21419.1 hypothetical protein DUT91_24195 [Phyllobacterium salinisoli]
MPALFGAMFGMSVIQQVMGLFSMFGSMNQSRQIQEQQRKQLEESNKNTQALLEKQKKTIDENRELTEKLKLEIEKMEKSKNKEQPPITINNFNNDNNRYNQYLDKWIVCHGSPSKNGMIFC